MTEHVIEISRSTEPLAGEPDEMSMTSWLKTVLKRLDCGPVELSIRLVSEEEMVSLNQRYRGKAAVTNVLSFPSGLEKQKQQSMQRVSHNFGFQKIHHTLAPRQHDTTS